MTTPKVSSKEQERLKTAFERTPTFFQLLTTLRSRRVGAGYTVDSGTREVHGVTGRRLESTGGPLSFVSTAAPHPLTELETALLCWAACGPNGIVAGDIGLSNNPGVLMQFGGRTIPAAGNDHAVELIFSNDEGTFLYRPTGNRTRVVEIESEADYPKVVEWFREGVVKLSDQRLDVDWAISPGRPMGIWQSNLNRPGTTWFIPVADAAKSMVNLYFSVFEHMHWLITDEDTGEPCGLERWARPGFLEVPITQRTYEEVMLHMADYQHGMLIQNLRLAAEALGLGCWIFGGFCEEIVMGGFRPLAKGLRFRYKVIDGKRNYVGLPKVLEGFGLPAPWHKSPDDLIDRVLALREDASSKTSYRPEVQETLRDNPAFKPSEWAVEATRAVLNYLFERYGRFPVYFSTFHSNLHAQLHHLDAAFYKNYFQPGYLNDRHLQHKATWHDDDTRGNETI